MLHDFVYCTVSISKSKTRIILKWKIIHVGISKLYKKKSAFEFKKEIIVLFFIIIFFYRNKLVLVFFPAG